MITPKKWEKLKSWMKSLDILEQDLREKFILGSGRGGQNLHKTASCVELLHIPSGLIIKCQQSRSRETNRYYAYKRLCEKIEEKKYAEKSKIQQEYEKIRRQKRKRSIRAKQKMLEQKHHRSAIKTNRKKPRDDNHNH